MKTGEAIEKVISVFDDWVLEYSCSNSSTDEKEEEKEGIIALLRQGEKYRQMLEDIRLECNDTLIEFPKSKITYSFNDIFKMFKQKYFPKVVE